MDRQFDADTASAQDEPEQPLVEETSAEYLGRWNRLVSTTNWEKGRIICAWRRALIEAAAPAGGCSDEAWSRRVGNVTPQHVGRLRRVYECFGQSHPQYPGLYWSHFQAALDWPDAEMWLEGAVQSDWSVAQMRQQRWEAIGAPPEMKPRAEDVIAAELDEDAAASDHAPMSPTLSGSLGVVQEAGASAQDPTEADLYTGEQAAGLDAADSFADSAAAEPLRPFEHLAPLPPDLNEALEAFKLAILHHKLSGWQEIACQDVLAALEALKELAMAPTQ